MAKFVINKDYADEKTVEARSFREVDSLVIFVSAADEKVFAIPTKEVRTIEKVPEQ